MISIIIPVYNKSEYIEITLNSLKNQSFNEWECIIIDDNSSDSSLEKIHSYLQNDLRFKIRDIMPSTDSLTFTEAF